MNTGAPQRVGDQFVQAVERFSTKVRQKVSIEDVEELHKLVDKVREEAKNGNDAVGNALVRLQKTIGQNKAVLQAAASHLAGPIERAVADTLHLFKKSQEEDALKVKKKQKDEGIR